MKKYFIYFFLENKKVYSCFIIIILVLLLLNIFLYFIIMISKRKNQRSIFPISNFIYFNNIYIYCNLYFKILINWLIVSIINQLYINN